MADSIAAAAAAASAAIEARVVAEEAEEKASHALASVDVNAATTTTKAK